MTRFQTLSLAGLLGMGLLAGGCSSSDHDHYSRRSGDDVVLSGERRGDVDRARGASTHVPRDAQVVDEGRGDGLHYTARGDGTVYLVDSSADTVVWSSPVRDGDRVTINPDKNHIDVNGRERANIDLKSNDRFQLYFERSSSSSRYDRY